MIKTRSPNQKTIVYNGKKYAIHGRYHLGKFATASAGKLRGIPYPWQESRVCGAIVCDLGKHAEPLRYGVFITKGGAWKKGRSIWLFDFQKSMLKEAKQRTKKDLRANQNYRALLSKDDPKYYDNLNSCDACEEALTENLESLMKEAYNDAEKNRLDFERSGEFRPW